MGGHHPLVLSLSQLQSGGGLLIVNPANGEPQPHPGQHHAPPHPHQMPHHQQQQPHHGHHGGHPQMNGLTPLTLPPPPTPTPGSGSTGSEVNGGGSGGGHLLHSAGSNRSSDTMESSASSNSPLDGLAPVSNAVRSLANLSDFNSLDVNNGNGFDGYGGITDSLLSESGKEREASGSKSGSESGGAGCGQAGQQHHRSASGGGAGTPSGPLLDFKSAFSDLDSKPSDLR